MALENLLICVLLNVVGSSDTMIDKSTLRKSRSKVGGD